MSLETAENIKITSQIINYPNRQGRNITAFYDYIDRQPQNNNLIIIPPAYGETKKDSLKISYFLVRNGFNCIRYDSTDHVGESYGDMLDASFEKMKDDLLSTLDFSETELKVSGVGLAGTSLGIRIGIKAASLDNRIKLILGLVPIVDIQSSLRAIYHQDILAEVMEGMYKGKTIDDIMGFEVSIDFALSAIKYKYHNLDTTFDDIKMADIPLVMISAENDPWSDPKSVQAVLEHSPSKNKEFILIPNAMHQLNENPEAAIFAIQQTVIKCKKYLLAQTISPKEVIIPSEDEMSRQWLIEEERLKILLKKDLEGEKAFWEKYLNKFLLINKSRDYRDFLKQVSEMLDIRQAERVLDAGCGNGHFGAWILHELIHKISNDKIPWDKFVAPEYFGLDFVENRIKEGRLKHLNMLRRIYRELCIRERYRIINYRYILADLDARLPFRDNFFDKICSNLVLSYVLDAQFSANELCRTLKQGGKIIISSMKPFADFSQIYRDFADQTQGEGELEEARKLLSAAGKIKQKESAGIYNFFCEGELKALLVNAGIKNITIVRSFSNQANIALGEK